MAIIAVGHKKNAFKGQENLLETLILSAGEVLREGFPPDADSQRKC